MGLVETKSALIVWFIAAMRRQQLKIPLARLLDSYGRQN